MTTQHTQGRLRFECGDSGSVAFNEDGTAVFEDCPHGGIGKIQGRENVRRLVACWNALDGIATERLEDYPSINSFYSDQYRQNVDLKAALNGLLTYFESSNSVPVSQATIKANSVEVHVARAAIAKAEGGAA